MNRKQNKTLATFAAIMVTGVAFWALPASAAQGGVPTGQLAQTQSQQPQMQQPVQQAPIYESEKAWKFEKDSLIFFNPSPNQGGVRYIRWKDYNWMILQNQIIVSDSRPYGTTLQGTRNQMTSDGPQSDKDLMNDLKGQAGDIRNSRDPNAGSLPISIGIGLGFDFSRRGGRHHHH
jgi:hypothetical protein